MTTQTNHILVVDDNGMNRLKLARSLEQDGYQVSLAANGEEALQKLDETSFDVVILDILMPVMDGYQVLEQMKARDTTRDIPVIVISALDKMDSVVRCIEMGAEDYLPKNFDPVLLRARLRASLHKKQYRDLERAYLQQEIALRQNEKLATLGKLSAGMAHELNNPSAAVQRGAKQLQAAVTELQSAQLQLSRLSLTAEQVDTLAALYEFARERATQPQTLTPLAMSDREVELEEWLEQCDVREAWRFAPSLAALGCDQAQLEYLTSQFPSQHLPIVMDWLGGLYNIYNLIAEMGRGAAHITHIVNALKSYTYLDQAPVQRVDVHEGLENTLIMMRTKLGTGIEIHREYAPELPHIHAYGSELNQVWTSIIDNAVDAMQGRGNLTLRTHHDDTWLVVEIEDNGPGIPEAIQGRIFDPFFTTKPPGFGAGMGLNISHNIIAQKHEGKLSVDSQPGCTRFVVKLPLDSNLA